ncbi:MAG: DUF4922 domain-containing protein [Acidobacteria bacterium]|nr:DUF4922 domain-containing protein [Acidobacteriota bacterium]
MLREATEGLSEVEYKKLSVKGSEVLAQFNPKRIVSTAARVDTATIQQRPCFLCAENLPPEEKGIEFGQDFIVLCNPFPVLRNHLVITARRHIPQGIEGNFDKLLDLSRELGDQWFTVYNGPKCGASAPDHLHFQACSRETLPILREIECWNRQAIFRTSAVEAFILRNYRINLMVARGNDYRVLINYLESALGQLARVTNVSEEPMINLIVTCEDRGWTVILFPRSKHRPSCYDAEGGARLTVSPAAIDLAGVLVVPRPEHFARISAEDVEKIYAEVTLDNERFRELINEEEERKRNKRK